MLTLAHRHPVFCLQSLLSLERFYFLLAQRNANLTAAKAADVLGKDVQRKHVVNK